MITVLQAAEGALRQAGLHESAADIEKLLRRFLHQRRGLRQGAEPSEPLPLLEPMAPQLPTRRSRRRLPRRIPGLP